MGLIAAIVDGRWQPGMGDSWLVGWATVTGHVLTLALCVRASRASMIHAAGLWRTLAVAMLVLAVSKSLDLPTWLGQVGRDLALGRGWYADRRTYQAMFVTVAGVVGLLAVACSVWLAVRRRWPVWPLVGALMLVGHLVARGISFHPLDEILSRGVAGIQLSLAIQLIGVTLIATSACWAARRRQPANQKPRSLVEIVAKYH